jgi:GTPase SAR1 family protein
VETSVQHRTAKVILVGDAGVGKSGLAHRLVHGEFVDTRSSHARKALTLDSSTVKTAAGVDEHRETVLWDLAGQPAYRLVHQLAMEDAAVACVLFDAKSETNPLEGAAYWSLALAQARTNTQITKLLVPARMDVGGLPVSQDRIRAFAHDRGFADVFPTSAFTGEGCDSLLEAVREHVRWDDLPAVSSTETLAALRDFVATLKGERQGLITIAELRRLFETEFKRQVQMDTFIAHLQRLEDTDAVDILAFHSIGQEPTPKTFVLLDPTRVDAYASALLVAAKDEPDGPGHLLESRVQSGDFSLPAEERLPDKQDERRLLWFVMESLLSRELALRERIRVKGKEENYVVFPAQCTRELKFPGKGVFGVAYGFAGPVKGIYATLIAQLAHYEGFSRRQFFQDAAAYNADAGGRCVVRLTDHGDGTGDLEVSFDEGTPSAVRQGFLEFVAKHLESRSKPGNVAPRYAYHCAKCQNPFEDRVVRLRLDAHKKTLICPVCEAKTQVVDLLVAPTAAAAAVAEQIDANAKAGRQRITAEWVIKSKEAEGKYDVFLSHNSKDKAAVEEIARRLKAVAIRPWLDKWDLEAGKSWVAALQKAIPSIGSAAVFYGPAGIGPWEEQEMEAFLVEFVSRGCSVLPVILPDAPKEPDLPVFLKTKTWVNMRDWKEPASDAFPRLVCGVLGKSPGDSPRGLNARYVWEWQKGGRR